MVMIHNILEAVILMVRGLGTLVVVWSVMQTIILFIVMKITSEKKDPVLESEQIRQHLGATGAN